MKVVNKQHDRETKLLIELREKHDYFLAPVSVVRGKNPYTSTINFKTRQVSQKYMVVFAVPLDSALGKAMIESDRRQERKKKTKRARAK